MEQNKTQNTDIQKNTLVKAAGYSQFTSVSNDKKIRNNG